MLSRPATKAATTSVARWGGAQILLWMPSRDGPQHLRFGQGFGNEQLDRPKGRHRYGGGFLYHVRGHDRYDPRWGAASAAPSPPDEVERISSNPTKNSISSSFVALQQEISNPAETADIADKAAS